MSLSLKATIKKSFCFKRLIKKEIGFILNCDSLCIKNCGKCLLYIEDPVKTNSNKVVWRIHTPSLFAFLSSLVFYSGQFL